MANNRDSGPMWVVSAISNRDFMRAFNFQFEWPMTLSDCQNFWVAFVGKIKSLFEVESRQVAKEEEKSLPEPVSERLPATTAENLESEQQNTQNPTQSISSNGISKKQRKKFYSNKKRQ